ncbi:cytochrome p450 [Oceaniovalibus guishaninsula JLT2003]|uniref:Cytochrome p450 n=2 Tax=Oceaniovalibus TaxID=1207070 RepID=K2HH78_9RHOB|nr:cytochrome p450 [Oceaniovalibus guishaninsula JLT2003]
MVTQNPQDPAFVADPYPFYHRIRAMGDLVRWQDYDLTVATSHAAVGALIRDTRLGRETPEELRQTPPQHLAPFYAVEDHSMLELERPRHTRLRGLVLRAFTSRGIAALAPEIEALSHTLIDGFPAGPFDLLDRYARHVPVIVIARLLGVPEATAPDLLRWSGAMTGMYRAGRTLADEVAAAGAAADFSDFLRDHIDRRRRDPGDDLLSHLIAAHADGDRLSEPEMIATAILLLNAGHEATVHALGNAVNVLLGTRMRPDDPAATVEEALRFDPPLHLFTRWVYEPLTFMGHDFARGDRVGLLLGATNRDPSVYEDPDRFDPGRWARHAPAPHLAFGAGPHFCVGAPLARMEMQIALRVLFDRCPDLALAEQPQVADIYHFRGLRRLLVTT